MRKPLTIKIQVPEEFTTYKGLNIPWLKFSTGAEEIHDGYGNAFRDTYFQGEGAEEDIKLQLHLIKSLGIKYIRLWLNIYHYMNADKEDVGFTAFVDDFIPNLQTFYSWCIDAGLEVLVVLDDSWYTFPFLWLNDEEKKQSYINACAEVVEASKNYSCVWGWDYANEPYMGWEWNNLQSQLHRVYGVDNVDVGYTRETLTTFFIDLYTTLKDIAPNHLFSVGSCTPADKDSKDLLHWNIKDASDFYQVHWFKSEAESFNYLASDYDKMVIVGEWGYSGGGSYTKKVDYNNNLLHKFVKNGFGLFMLWSWTHMKTRNGTLNYSLAKGLPDPAFFS